MTRAQATVMSAVSVTGTNTYKSMSTSARRIREGSYVLIWTGTPTGTPIIEVSNDPETTSDASATWTPLPTTGSGAPAGAMGNTGFFFQGLSCGRMRLSYANTSGTGTLTAHIEAHGD